MKKNRKIAKRLEVNAAFWEGCLDGILWAELYLLRSGFNKALKSLKKDSLKLRQEMVRRAGPIRGGVPSLTELENAVAQQECDS